MTHFLEEEVEMYRHNYPEFEQHKQLHDQFVTQVRDMYIRFYGRSGGQEYSRIVCAEIVAVLTDWLKSHIMVVDRRYADFFRERNVK